MDTPLDWSESATGEFNKVELARLQNSSAEELIGAFSVSAGDVVIRGLTELLAHGEVDKLRQVGTNPAVAAKWQNEIVATFSPDMFRLLALSSFFGT